jgi:Asp-tRNA(Asn)/Glu-tRNA(Gln) amidotransferase A subunit family amidase
MVAVAAVGGLPVAEFMSDPEWEPLRRELIRQVLAAGPADDARAGGDGAVAQPGIDDDGRGLAEVPVVLGGVPGTLVRRLVELVRGVTRGRRVAGRANVELLAAYERLERLGRPINAVVAAVPVSDPPPGLGGSADARGQALAGRAVAIKDIVAVAGVPTRCGSPASDPRPAERDAVVVARLRGAGAEILATTQCLEYAAGFAHPDVGDTRNPRDRSRTSGGSSGGSAALVAAGVCELALGTDTGGSIRIPAAYCGVVGFKPTYGLVPVDGVFPLSPSCDHVGTLTATVGGAAALLEAVTGGAGEAAVTGPVVLGVLSAQLADSSVTDEVRKAIRGALTRLGAAGWEIRELDAAWVDRLRKWEETLTRIVAREAAGVHHGRDQSGYAEGTRALLDYGGTVTDEQYAGARGEQAELAAAIDASLAGVTVLAGPAVGYPAPEQDPPFGTGADHGEGRFTGPYNLSGHPAVSLPVPTAGLPAGLQLAGRRGGDRALLAAAAAAECVLAGQEP